MNIELNPADEEILKKKGISKEQIENQLNYFKTGFPFLEIRCPAYVGNGITKVSSDEIQKYLDEWEKYYKKTEYLKVDTFCDIPAIILPFLLFSFLPIFLFYANLLLIGFIYFAFC